MEFKEIRSLIELLKDTDITELQIDREGSKVRIKREKFPAAPAAALQTVQDKTVAQEQEKKEEVIEKSNLVTITSPIVGIFHRASSPEATPFVEAGAVVSKGQVLCIIEAMKLMNEIESDTNGKISKILIENGHPVEYGEPLFQIEPA